MDRFIQLMQVATDGDLMLCDGLAYQADMRTGCVAYDAGYLAKCRAYEGSATARAVNAGRCALLSRNLREGADVLDVGAGSGAFVRDAASWGFAAKGFDVIPETADMLRAEGLYSDDLGAFDAVTMWDVLEHVEDAGPYLNAVRDGGLLFVSLPIYTDLSRVRESKHYRPGEHLYHFTAAGLIAWLAKYGYRLIEESGHEIAAGRDSIGAFAFRRRLCDCGAPVEVTKMYVRCTRCERSSFVRSEIEAFA